LARVAVDMDVSMDVSMDISMDISTSFKDMISGHLVVPLTHSS